MESLGRYPLSIILFYLPEYDGTSFMLTKKRYATQLLPLFRIKDSSFDSLQVLSSSANGSAPRKHMHKFVVCPVNDATVLLARLNTRKLCRRKRPRESVGYTTTELARLEWSNPSHIQQFPADQTLLRFLTKQTNDFSGRGITLLASYPRSGNSLLRSLLERTTGIVTGSDTRPDRNLSRELAEQHNLVGEGVVQNVAFVKTHWPERQGAMPVTARRAILLVRNPYDAIDSYWNMNATKSHVKTVTDEVYERFRDKFEALAENEIKIWNRFNRYWLNDVDIPVLLIRFEDLIQDPAKELTKILQFTLCVSVLSHFWQDRIQHVTGTSIEQLGSYQPRSAGGHASIGKSLRKSRYSEKLLRLFHEASENAMSDSNLLSELGYEFISGDFTNGDLDLKQSAFLRANSSEDLIVNEGMLVRPISCLFGRALTAWRHSITDGDKSPLPTASR
ncbi:hypothetical protein MPSEU_000864900 [Mayamaea pseudoterrestris]|nr:hypothetical protein MPSEU_000864900 [Mayamaea pseudoterrestris]